MHISNTQLGLQAQHTRTHLETSRERLQVWTGNRPDGRATPADPESRSGTGPAWTVQRAQPPRAVPAAPPARAAVGPSAPPTEVTAPSGRERPTLEPRMQTLVRMIEAITGRPVRLAHLEDAGSGPSEVSSPTVPSGGTGTPANGSTPPAGWGLVYERDTTRIDTERLSIEAQGRVLTADGREISFELNVTLQTQHVSTRSSTLRAGDAVLKDPLVIHFDGPVGELRDTRFSFDLDADGQSERMPFVGQGSGFLVLDRNGNGAVDDGRELFGALSGNGFADLAAFDDDGNGWIDGGDAVFEQLKVWRMDADGHTRLQSLSGAGVGAVGLAHAATPMALSAGPSGPTLGQLRSSGVYLSHSGQAGWVQQIDLAV